MTTHYVASYDGHQFVRSTTGRKYTHMVVAVHNLAYDRTRAENVAQGDWKRDLSWLTWKASLEAGKSATFHVGRPFTFQNGFSQSEIDNAKAELAKGEEGRVADVLARFDSTSRLMSSDGRYYYTTAGWAGRPDLAMKLQSTTAEHCHKAVILEVEEVAKRPKDRGRV